MKEIDVNAISTNELYKYLTSSGLEFQKKIENNAWKMGGETHLASVVMSQAFGVPAFPRKYMEKYGT